MTAAISGPLDVHRQRFTDLTGRSPVPTLLAERGTRRITLLNPRGRVPSTSSTTRQEELTR